MTESGEPNRVRKVAFEVLYIILSVLIGLILGGGGVLIILVQILCPGEICATEFAIGVAVYSIIGGIAGAILAPIGAGLARFSSKLPWWVGAIIGGLIPSLFCLIKLLPLYQNYLF